MQRISAITCQRLTEDNSMQIAIITPLFGILAIVFFLLRILARYLTGMKSSWGYDDWVMLPTVVSMTDSRAQIEN